MRKSALLRSAAPLLLMAVFASCGSDDGTAPPTLSIETTSPLPAAQVGEVYTESVTAVGGSGGYTWSIASGALPDGLSLAEADMSDDAVITGTPEQEQTASFTLRVRSGDGQTATRSFTLEVQPPPGPVGFGTPALAPAMVSGAYDITLKGAGGDGSYTWRLVAGTLPAGLEFTSAGRLHGTPTATDTVTLTIEVTSNAESAQRDYVMRVVAHRTGEYNITDFAVVEIPASLAPLVQASIDRWEAAVTGDLQAIQTPTDFFREGDCGGFGELVNGVTMDDMLMIINIASIDGPGNVLGQAGPCGIRGSNDLPFVGILTLDADDLEAIVASHPEAAADIIAHEMGHVLGYGSLWAHFGLVSGAGTSDPRFTGQNAVAEYQALGGIGDVPLEAEGPNADEGTAEVHWRESVFDNELMTGFAEQPGTEQPLSRVSIASLEDLGYTVNPDAADPYALPTSAFRLGDELAPHEHLGYDVVGLGPVRVLAPDGSVTTIQLH